MSCSSASPMSSTTVVSLSTWRRRERPFEPVITRPCSGTQPLPPSVSAVVLTHRRPRLATAVVRSLIEEERLTADRMVVVVNGSGGLDDPALESSVRLVRLPRNVGPAGGFGAGIEAAFADPSVHWAYLCEDDVGLFSLPSPRLADVVGRAERHEAAAPDRPVGAVVAYGRRFVGRGAHTENLVPPAGDPYELAPVDVASWGATLLSRSRLRRRHPPRSDLVLRARGLRLLLSGPPRGIRRAGRLACRPGRSRINRRRQAEPGALAPYRPTDERETWRSYYHARNSILWPGATAALPGICGTWPTRLVICRRPRGTPSARPSCTGSGMASGVASERTRIRPDGSGSTWIDPDEPGPVS